MPKRELRTGNVLLMDVIRYSPRTDDQQSQIIEVLNRLVNETPTMRNASEEDRICLPTGDGLAMAFFRDSRSSIYFALELDERLRDYNLQTPEEDRFGLRMGINQGLVYVIKDINQRNNLAGDGINRVQRVTDCGDEGHILISQSFADSIARADSELALLFHPLGEFEVKHGEKIAIANIYDDKSGNREMPTRNPRVGGTLYDVAPAVRIMLIVSRPLVGYCREDDQGQLILVNPSALMDDIRIRPLPPPGGSMEIEALRRALQKAEAHVEISVMHGATPRSLVENLYEGNIRVLHFDGLGSRHGSQVLESPHGEAHLLSPELLEHIVSEYGIRLVVLRTSHLAECVEALRSAGVPTVVGMADTMKQDAAVAFISRFYRGLARGRPLNEAVERGRLMVKLLFGDEPGGENTIVLSAEDEKASLVQTPHQGAPPIFNSYATKPATIPESDAPFTGRVRERVRLIKELARGGVVELCGEDGLGKTTLAREVAQWHMERGRFPGGIFWVDMTDGGSKESVLNAVGSELTGYGFRSLMPEDKEAFINDHLRNEPSLIILDNLDTVSKDGELRRWLPVCGQPPSALLLTTEQDMGIGRADRIREMDASEARKLFIQYARHKGWDGPMDEEVILIDEICHIMGYIPLPIVLIASRTPVFALHTLKKELQQNMETIADTDNIFLPERYRTVNICLNVSYKLLDSEDARLLLRRLLILMEKATDELIKTACGVNNWPSAVTELIRSSLLHKDGGFYRLHPLVRQYALARLKEHGEESTYIRRMADVQHYYTQTQTIKEELGNKSKTASSLSRLSLLHRERGDLRTAVQLLAIAHDIFAAIGSPNTVKTQEDLEALRDKIGDENYNYWLNEGRSDPDAVVREVLERSQQQYAPMWEKANQTR